MQAVLMFIDGLGAGSRDENINPMAAARGKFFSNFRDDPPGKRLPFGGVFRPLDATLGIEGLPQSATGQTSLLTGRNAQSLLGRHLFGFPNETLRRVLYESSILKRVVEGGRTARFANAFRPLFFELPPEEMTGRLSATTIATLAAGVPFFGLNDLRAGNCVYQDFTNEYLVKRGFDVPLMTPSEAGLLLARVAERYDFVLYEYFLSDRSGHSGEMDRALKTVGHLEEFIEGFLSKLDLSRAIVVAASDHGNLEDLSFKGHTKNPVQSLVFGPDAEERSGRLESLLDVCPLLLDSMGVTGPSRRPALE